MRPAGQRGASQQNGHSVHGDELAELEPVMIGHLERGESVLSLLVSAWETRSPVLRAVGRAILADPEWAAELERRHCPRRRTA